MLETALQVAKTGISDASLSDKVSIVASLPPLNASYDHTVAPDFESAYTQYRELVSLQKARVDAFLLETMSNIARLVPVLRRSVTKELWVPLLSQ